MKTPQAVIVNGRCYSAEHPRPTPRPSSIHSPSKNSRSSPLASKEEAQAMTSPFIEKLARAAYEISPDTHWERAHPILQKVVIMEVRAILTAMREPSEEMLDAAIAADSASSCETVWQAMLTQALKK